MDVEEVRQLVRGAVKHVGTMKALSAEWGVSVVYISDVCSGKRDPGKAILEQLGLRKVVLYMDAEDYEG